MEDTIEKVYCTGDGGNDNLAAALLARGRDNDPATMLAAMNGGMGGGWNNPFAYMMMLGMFRFMYGDGWNGQNGNVQRAEIQSQIDSLRNQMSDNHNSDLLMGAIQGNNQDLKTLAANLNCDFNALQSSVCGIQAAIQDVGGKVGFSAERVIKASEQMKNVDGTSHRWTVDEIRLATNNEIISKGATIGDILYLANMAYADFYPKVIKTESDCVQYAIAVASDPDGYEGMAFCRWTADIIGKGVTIDWEKLE